MPDWSASLRPHLDALRLDPRREAEIVEELSQHLDQRYEELRNDGVEEAEAQRQVIEELNISGGLAGYMRPLRQTRVPEPIHNTREGFLDFATFIQDARFSFRILLSNRTFTAVAVLSLALGIGAAAALYGYFDTLFFRSLPVPAPNELVSFEREDPSESSFPYSNFEKWRSRTQVFQGMFATTGTYTPSMKASGDDGGDGETITAERLSSDFFSTLGVQPFMGRTFAVVDDRTAPPDPVAVLSYGFWQRRFGMDPQVLGRVINLNNQPFTIIGIMPRGFLGVEVGANPDMWLPLSNRKGLLDSFGMQIMARLKPGVTLAQANVEVAAVYRQIKDEKLSELGSGSYPVQRKRIEAQTATLVPGRAGIATTLRMHYERPLIVLTVTVICLLLVSCANIAGLLTARGIQRQREFAVRLSIGGSRSQLVRQLLTEAALLGLMSGLASLVVAYWAMRILSVFGPASGSNLAVALNLRTLGFTIATTVWCVLLLGVFPALSSTKTNISFGLKEASVNLTSSRSRIAWNKLLVSSQMALSVVLLVSAGLFVRTLHNLRSLDTGFSKNVVVFSVNRVPEFSRLPVFVEGLKAVPGVEAATFFADSGLLGGNMMRTNCLERLNPSQRDEDPPCVFMLVGPRFFETTRTKLLSGREFRSDDLNPVILNYELARRLFGGQSPLGKKLADKGGPLEVVGVSENSYYSNLREATPPMMYLPLTSLDKGPGLRFAVRGKAAENLPNDVRRYVRAFETGMQVAKFQTLDERVESTLRQERLIAEFSRVFAVWAAVLACIGLYGTMSTVVARRTQEIGIRIALGARVSDITRILVKEAAWIIGAGILTGLAVAVVLARIAAQLLFGLKPYDPLTIAVVTLALVFVSLVAIGFPARRASRLDPTLAIRSER